MSEDNINVTVEGGDGEFSEETRKYIAEKADETKRLAAEAARLNQETARANAESAACFRTKVEMEIGARQQEMAVAREQRRQAWESGDYDQVEATEQRIRNAEAEISQWHQYAQQNAPRVQAADPVENFASQLPPRSAQWVRLHPEYVRDPRKHAKLHAAASDALAEGHAPDSDGYMRHIERFVGAQNGDDVQSPRARQQVQASPRSGGRSVTLTQKQVETANDGTIIWGANDLRAGRIKNQSLIGQPIGTTEYARRLHSQLNDGGQRLYDDGTVRL